MRIKNFLSVASLSIGLFSSIDSHAQSQQLNAPYFKNLGSFHHVISTKNPLAQHYFDQGMVLFYGFEWGEAIRSFKEAARLDPHCGMCYWGLALALGNIMNAPLTGHEYADAQAAIQQALALKADETPKEQGYINALALRFQHAPVQSTPVGVFSCHVSSTKQQASGPDELKNYADAMQKLAKKNPADSDIQALYAYALFNRIDWKFWDANAKINPLTPEIIKTLKKILAKNPMNLGGNHYYVHVIEQSPHPEDALASADRLKTLVPGSEHLVHMPTHIYFLTGRYHQGTASNLQAIKVYQQYNKMCLAQGFEPEINYLYLHNYDFLRTTAMMEGRKKLALAAANHIVDAPFPTWLANEPMLQWFIPIPYFAKTRFGMWKELLKEPMPKPDYQYATGMWHYARGMAYAHTNDVKAAKNESAKLQQILAKGVVENALGKPGHELLTIANEILAATIANDEGNEDATLAHLKLAEQIQHDMGYHEPPDWYMPVKELLGDAYLKWNHLQEAVAVYQQDLQQYPKNGWALYGLASAQRRQGNEAAARQTEQEFKKAWQYADIPTPLFLFNLN